MHCKSLKINFGMYIANSYVKLSTLMYWCYNQPMKKHTRKRLNNRHRTRKAVFEEILDDVASAKKGN